MGVLAACSSAPTNPGAEDGTGSSSGGGDAATFNREGSVYDSTPSPESGLGQLLFRPDRVYSGTDGTHTFKVPVAVYDADPDLTIVADDPSALTLTKTTLTNPISPDGVVDNGKYYLVTALKAGTYTLTATSRGRSTTATVTISSYTSDRYGTGDARYKAAGTGVDRPCTDCHVNNMAIDHSPAALATASDQDIGVIITTGVKPGVGPGGPSVIKITSEPGTQHKWNVTDAQKDGLVTFLRALNPRGFQ
jgi:hypothetical protein